MSEVNIEVISAIMGVLTYSLQRSLPLLVIVKMAEVDENSVPEFHIVPVRGFKDVLSEVEKARDASYIAMSMHETKEGKTFVIEILDIQQGRVLAMELLRDRPETTMFSLAKVDDYPPDALMRQVWAVLTFEGKAVNRH